MEDKETGRTFIVTFLYHAYNCNVCTYFH